MIDGIIENGHKIKNNHNKMSKNDISAQKQWFCLHFIKNKYE